MNPQKDEILAKKLQDDCLFCYEQIIKTLAAREREFPGSEIVGASFIAKMLDAAVDEFCATDPKMKAVVEELRPKFASKLATYFKKDSHYNHN